MIGYTAPSNDLYIFFEGDEIKRLETEKVVGTFVNFDNPSVTGSLDAVVDDSLPMSYQVKTPTEKDDDLNVITMSIQMRGWVYDALKRRRTVEIHEGFRHVCLRDADNLEFQDQFNYEQLKEYV